MDFKGEPFGSESNSNLQQQIDTLTTNLGTTNTNLGATNTIVTSNTNTITRINDAAITTGPPTATMSSIFPTNVTPSSIVGTFFIPFSDCRVGMAFRIKVFTSMRISPVNAFRLYVSQDANGNFPWTPLDYLLFPANAQDDNFTWEFNIGFRAINPVNAWGVMQMNQACYYADSSVNPITTNGVIFYIIGQWGGSTGAPDIRNFSIKNLTLERIAGFV